MDALGLLSKASTKFFHEVAPVALASVIGTMLVNHYTQRAAPAPVVVEQRPSPPEAIVQTLHDEHQLIIDYLKRDAEAREAMSEKRSQSRAEPAASAAKEGPAKRVASGEKATPRPRSNVEKAREPSPLGPDLASLPGQELPSGAGGLPVQGSNVASAIGGLAAAVWRYPEQTLPKLSLADLPAPLWPFAWWDGAVQPQSDVAARH